MNNCKANTHLEENKNEIKDINNQKNTDFFYVVVVDIVTVF